MKSSTLRSLIGATLIALAGSLCGPRLASAAHTKSDTPSSAPAAGESVTPKGALIAYDDALPEGGMQAAMAAYKAENDDEKAAVKAMAEVDVATAELEHKVKAKFGAAAGDTILHAARNATRRDLDEASEKVDGDHAVITWKLPRPAVPMVKVDGKWRISVAGIIKDIGKDFSREDLVQSCGDIAKQLRLTMVELAAGEYPNITLLERAVQQRMFKVLGEDN